MTMYQADNVNDLEKIYSILKQKNPNNQIEVVYDYNKKIYFITPTNKPFEADPDVPVDLQIEVVYGDSVLGDTPLLLKNNSTNKITIMPINALASVWKDYPEFKILDTSVRINKQYGLCDYNVWCDKGWTPIKKVIRHRTSKDIYRVLTETGIVDVTEDHSLCSPDLKKVKPVELVVGQRLLHSYPSVFPETMLHNDFSEIEAYLWGIFCRTGQIVKKSGELEWYIECNDMLFLLEIKKMLEQIYNDEKFTLLNGVIKVVKPSVKFIATYSYFYINGIKTIPDVILNAPVVIKKKFMDGVFNSKGHDNSIILNEKLVSQGLFYIMKSIGMNVSIDVFKGQYSNSNFIYMNMIEKEFNKEKETCIKNITKIQSTNFETFVYDLETECGRFNAGIGQLTISNTDSCFLKYKYNRDNHILNRKDTFRLGTICGERLTNDIFARPPIEMEFEKVFQPFILLTKKRYIGKKYEDTSDPLKLKGIDAKGIALTRRDYSGMVKKCYKEVIDVITKSDDTKDIINGIRLATEIYKQYIDKIVKYDIKIEELETSATLAKEYSCSICKKKCEWSSLKCIRCKKNNIDRTKSCQKCNAIFECVHTFSLAHVNLATKMLQRREEINVNDRIPFVYIESDDPRAKKAELAETPKHDLKFNRVIYLEQLAKTLLGFFKIVLNDNRQLLNNIIDYTNNTLESLGSKKLKPSDFIQPDDI